MFQRIIRRSNYIINNTPISFSKNTNTTYPSNQSVIDGPKIYYLKKDLKNHPVVVGDPDWKIKELVKKELEKEGLYEKKVVGFSGLLGILFFIVFLYERRII